MFCAFHIELEQRYGQGRVRASPVVICYLNVTTSKQFDMNISAPARRHNSAKAAFDPTRRDLLLLDILY